MGSLLETFYPLMPAWAQSIGISIYGLGWRRERLGGHFRQYVREFRERDAWSPEKFQTYLNQELRKALSRAVVHVPYYRDVWQGQGISANDLLRLTTSD